MKNITWKSVGQMRLNDLKDEKLRLTSFSLVVSALLPVMAVGCSTDDGGISEPTTITVSSIKLNQTSATLNVGETIDLTATVSPENATDKTVTWSSSDSGVATVSDGKVTAVSVGSSTITARCGNAKSECAVTVSPIEVISVTLDQTSLTLTAGETIDLTATVSPENATDKTVTWSSSDSDVATVSDGKVTAVSVGSSTITARCGNVKSECAVTVSPIEVTSVTLDQTSVTLTAGETVRLTATVSPDNATDKTITWTSSNTSFATVKNGEVTAVAVGSATVTAKCGKVKAECTITVKAIDVISVTLNKSSVTLSAGETVQLSVTVSPDNATNKTVTWNSSNTNVATVSNGNVTALAAGSATITAIADNGLSSTCRIAVVEAVPPGGSEGTGEEEWK